MMSTVNNGVVAIRIEASPPVIWVCAVRISPKGSTLLNSAIATNGVQPERSDGKLSAL